MKEPHRILAYSAFCGAVGALGFASLAFWHIARTSPNAGAMVDGVFRPYADDDSLHVTAIVGAVLLIGAIAGLVRAWRRISRDQAL